jgi:sterol desaturase/sphingolipid hydroxylase (fatty acid hydroxylase superfamily)
VCLALCGTKGREIKLLKSIYLRSFDAFYEIVAVAPRTPFAQIETNDRALRRFVLGSVQHVCPFSAALGLFCELKLVSGVAQNWGLSESR